ncbi:MAG: hypothetical protein IPJ86_02890 [Bacteroidetes bacterium]|nr:hypothetical protein [Bacteroidota bacterium]MBL0096159.1 hypothetical protein [Bacteroidota bacterium]
MIPNHQHTFHIPVMGLGFTIDSPAKIAKYGISSVISIMEDELIESMRAFYCKAYGITYQPIKQNEEDYRARRITAYLNTINQVVNIQFETLKKSSFSPDSELSRYFELLPDSSPLRKRFIAMCAMPEGIEKTSVQQELRSAMKPGSIDVNIMAKADRLGYSEDGKELLPEFSNALSSLRGFAKSDLKSSLVISAGYNPRLYSYIGQFKDFFPDENGMLTKKIVLKVSDYRSAQIQGLLLAKKGIWVSEFRVESGLNCGGHAFPTEGLLTGPILEEFKEKKESLREALKNQCNTAWEGLGIPHDHFNYEITYSAQGGIGTFEEDTFLRKHYQLDYTGWGSPFLLVPECTNVDEETLKKLTQAEPSDYYLSYASPLGVPFYNFRLSSANTERINRIKANRPGSPCYKKHLASNTEFTTETICTASREYQQLKIKSVTESAVSEEEKAAQIKRITEKECLCEGLSTATLLKNKLPLSHKLKSVSICPGPNMAFFSRIATLEEMCGHIYGRTNLISKKRPHLFINELKLYVDYFKRQMASNPLSNQELKYLNNFKNNLLKGIDYYKNLFLTIQNLTVSTTENMILQLREFEEQLQNEEAFVIG